MPRRPVHQAPASAKIQYSMVPTGGRDEGTGELEMAERVALVSKDVRALSPSASGTQLPLKSTAIWCPGSTDRLGIHRTTLMP